MRVAAAGLLGLLVPGAGHAFLGRRRTALVFLVPFMALLGAGFALYLTGGLTAVLAFVVTPGVLPALAILNVALAIWRLAAGLDVARRSPEPRVALGIVGVGALVLVLAPHLWAGLTISATNDLLDSVFAPESTPGAQPTDAPPFVGAAWAGDPGEADPYGWDWPDATDAPGATPRPSRGPFTAGTGGLPGLGVAVPWDRPGAVPWGSDGRFDLLLLGSDAGPDRWSRRMDVMLLVEVDVATGRVAMIGLPRNLFDVPFPDGSPAANATKPCGCFSDLLNALYVEATVRHPGRWPGSGAVKGIGAVRSTISSFIGRPVDAVLVADLWGVIKVVDAMGGVDIYVPAAVHDDHYPDPVYGSMVLDISAGQHHFDGRMALAYARSRHQDSDYGRMKRQQTLLLAIRADINASTILDAPALAAAAKGFVWTDLPRDSLPNLVDLFGRAATASVRHLRIVPPTYPEFITPAVTTKIRKDVAALLGTVPPPTPGPSPSPAPSASPEPSPTEAPSPPPTEPPPTAPAGTVPPPTAPPSPP